MTQVVILPGLDGTAHLLEEFSACLWQSGVSADVISYPPDQPLDYLALESLVRARLPASGSFVLLGESFSGPLAIRIAANPPAGLVGLVLSTTFARAPVPALAPFARFIRFAPARPPMWLLSWWLLGPWGSPTLRAALQAALHSVDPSVLRMRAAAALRVDVSALLPSVRVPALQLLASRDRLLTRSAARALSGGLPHIHTTTITGPHLLLQTSIAACVQAVAGFALGLAAANGPSPPGTTQTSMNT